MEYQCLWGERQKSQQSSQATGISLVSPRHLASIYRGGLSVWLLSQATVHQSKSNWWKMLSSSIFLRHVSSSVSPFLPLWVYQMIKSPRCWWNPDYDNLPVSKVRLSLGLSVCVLVCCWRQAKSCKNNWVLISDVHSANMPLIHPKEKYLWCIFIM